MHTDGQFLSTVKNNNNNKKSVIRKANEQQAETFFLFLNSDIKTLSVKALCSITYEEQLDLAEAEVADWVITGRKSEKVHPILKVPFVHNCYSAGNFPI